MNDQLNGLQAEKQGRAATFEDLLASIKSFGRWQFAIVLFTIYFQLFTAMTNLEIVFYQITPDFACEPPGMNETDLSLAQIRNLTAPINEKGERDRCNIYDVDYFTLANSNWTAQNQTNTTKCAKWIYDRSDMAETVVTQWDLVCDNMWMVEHGSSANFGAMLFGSLLSGFLSDRFGRKPAMFFGITIMGLGSVLLSFVPSYTLFIIVRFCVVIGKMCAALANFCYTMECTTGKARTWIGGLFFIPYAVGYSLLAGIAYLAPDWRHLNLIVAGPILVLLLFWWIFPESPRWLLAQGKVDEARKVIETASRLNGVQMPDVDLNQLSKNIAKQNNEHEGKKVNILHVFKHPTLAIRTVTIWCIWFINTMVYYGLSLNVSSFAGNVFVNNALAGAPVEIPAYAVTTALLHVGRRPAGYITLFLCAVFLGIAPFIPDDLTWLKVALGLLGKLSITVSYTVIYVHTTELFPTMMRNSGLALSSAVSRFGTMLAPYVSGISKLGKSYQWLPLLIFGAFALGGAFATFFLPETKGKKMPESIQEAIEQKGNRWNAIYSQTEA